MDIPRPSRLGDWSHLAVRFLRALWPGAPRASDVEWVRGVLNDGEFELWSRQPAHDRRHTIGVARGVERALAGTEYAGDARWLAAALLHDIGKLQSHLSVYSRVVATIAGRVTRRQMVHAWSASRGFTRRVGLYLDHGPIGADLVRMAGGRDAVATWAGVHHDHTAWAGLDIPEPVVRALVLSDAD